MSDGDLLIGSTGNPPALAQLTPGAGISITPGAGTITIANTGTGVGFTWVAAPADASLVNGQGAVNTKVTLLTMTLPATAAVGDVIGIQGSAAGLAGWSIAQNALQNIQLGNVSSTIGVGGSFTSTNANDGCVMVCTLADTTWNVISAIGNITIV